MSWIGVRKYIYNFRTFLLAKCPKKLYKYRTGGHVRYQNPAHFVANQRCRSRPRLEPTDFCAPRQPGCDRQTLQRMVLAGDLRRVDRGGTTNPSSIANPAPTTRTIGRSSMLSHGVTNCVLLVDGMTAANDLGNGCCFSSRYHSYRRTPPGVKLDKLVIDFQTNAPSRLYWAGRPPCELCRLYIG